MNETPGKPAQCTAIAEKKPHRPGGCVGIFFQLFDWNRRFAKKKLFSRKLLPPVRAKKFGGDDKMPKSKPHLIADENSGGFPNAKKNGNGSDSTAVQKHEMRAAGLVVRLMGLESMPAVNRDKQKKASNSDLKDDKYEVLGSQIEVLNSEKGGLKIECRPQKLQKTGQFDRRAVTRFGAEALQIKNVLSRSKKHHYSKLASPVKSPRLSSSRNVSRTSRLIDAATRILEPGLQATSRAKCALPYTDKSEIVMDNMRVAKSFAAQSSCKNCGNLLEENSFTPTMEKQVLASPFSTEKMAFLGSEWIKSSPMVSSLEQEGPEVYCHPKLVATGKFDSKQRSQKDETSSSAFLQRTETPTDKSVGRSRIPPKTKSNSLQSKRACSAGTAITGAKDFVALNRSLTSQSSPSRVSNNVEICRRKFCSRRDDSLSQARTPVRKRRTGSVNAQLESTGAVNSKPLRSKHIKCDLVSGKRLEPNARNVGQECIKARTSSQGASNKDQDAVSFNFNSPLKHDNETRDEVDKNACYQRQMPLNGDSLGALLELKLRELTSQEDDELVVGGAAPKRSTALILQELISALTAHQPSSPESHLVNLEKTFQTEVRAWKAPVVGSSHDGEYLCPGSVLEASFSNDSCMSSSLDDFSGRRLLYDSMDYSETDVNHSNSVKKIVTDLLNSTSGALQSIHLANGGLRGSRFNYVKEVIFNAELLFNSKAVQNSDRTKNFFVCPCLFDELEVMAGALGANLGFEDSKDGSRAKRFLFDCMIEYLDSKYGCFKNPGFKAWRMVQSCMNIEMVVDEVVQEVRRWASFSEMMTDEIVEWELSHSLGKWTGFEFDEFEIGAEIDWDILEVLLDETVMELWD